MIPAVGDIERIERDERDQRFLEAWERRTSSLIVVAAIVPILVVLLRGRENGPTIVLDLASWAIFLADFLVHLRCRRGYLRSRVGVFDTVILVLTAPWYLLPWFGAGRFVAIGRLARLGRVFVASKSSKRLRDLGRRLGHAALYGVALMFVCAIVVRAEEPASSGFDTFGDAMWWALVTFTTVGYGDLYPVTAPGRLAGVLLMLGGIALIGSLAATLGSFLSASDRAEEEAEEAAEDAADELSEERAHEAAAALQRELVDEVRALRAEIAALRADRPDSTTA